MMSEVAKNLMCSPILVLVLLLWARICFNLRPILR